MRERRGEETGRTCQGTHGGRMHVWRPLPLPALGVSRALSAQIASWGGGHTPYSSPPGCSPLILASSESRSKLTFCILHYARPRGPQGRGPAPAPRRQLDWAINLRAPHPPLPAPSLCAPDRRPPAPARRCGLLALIRHPAPPGPRLCQGAARPGRRAAVSHPISAPPPLRLGPSV